MAAGGESNNVALMVRWLHLGIRRALDEALVEHGLTGPQATALRHIQCHTGIEQRALQEQMGVTSPTLTGLVDGLAERELLTRRVSPEDGRVKQLFLTERGCAVSARLGEAMVKVEARLLEGFSAPEQALLRAWLARLAANIGAPGGDACE